MSEIHTEQYIQLECEILSYFFVSPGTVCVATALRVVKKVFFELSSALLQ
jgi:hypothetical protein